MRTRVEPPPLLLGELRWADERARCSYDPDFETTGEKHRARDEKPANTLLGQVVLGPPSILCRPRLILQGGRPSGWTAARGTIARFAKSPGPPAVRHPRSPMSAFLQATPLLVEDDLRCTTCAARPVQAMRPSRGAQRLRPRIRPQRKLRRPDRAGRAPAGPRRLHDRRSGRRLRLQPRAWPGDQCLSFHLSPALVDTLARRTHARVAHRRAAPEPELGMLRRSHWRRPRAAPTSRWRRPRLLLVDASSRAGGRRARPGLAGGGPAPGGGHRAVGRGQRRSTDAARHARAARGTQPVPLPQGVHPRARSDPAPVLARGATPSGRASARRSRAPGDGRGIRGRLRRSVALRADLPPRRGVSPGRFRRLPRAERKFLQARLGTTRQGERPPSWRTHRCSITWGCGRPGSMPRSASTRPPSHRWATVSGRATSRVRASALLTRRAVDLQGDRAVGSSVHLAFTAPTTGSRSLSCRGSGGGGRDNGRPGPRADYGRGTTQRSSRSRREQHEAAPQ
jgi:hypothetical protein